MRLPTNISMGDLKNHKWVKAFHNFTSSNGFTSLIAKIIVTIIIWSCVLIPTWIYFLIRLIASPDTFWQEFAIVVICMVVMGWLQALLAIGGFMLTMAAIFSDEL